MANLQNAVISTRGIDQVISFFERRRHRFFNEHVNSLLHQAAADLCVHNCGNGHARGVHSSAQFLERTKRLRAKFRSKFLGATRIRIEYAHKVYPVHLLVNARMIASEFAAADHGHTDSLVFRAKRHSLFIPFAAPIGSTTAGTAGVPFPAWLANSISFSRSKKSVRPASTASAVAPQARIRWMVGKPTTGTSKRMSCFGLLTFTTTSRLPEASRAARSIVSSVPSIASTATQALSEITTVCPMSIPAMCRATPRP